MIQTSQVTLPSKTAGSHPTLLNYNASQTNVNNRKSEAAVGKTDASINAGVQSSTMMAGYGQGKVSGSQVEERAQRRTIQLSSEWVKQGGSLKEKQRDTAAIGSKEGPILQTEGNNQAIA